jgi:hypothetical protein
MIQAIARGSRDALFALALAACDRTCANDGAATDAGRATFADAGGVPAAVIAGGKTFWTDSLPDEPLINARVDIGTLHSVGADEIEVVLEWPSAPGSLMTWRSLHPGVTLPMAPSRAIGSASSAARRVRSRT